MKEEIVEFRKVNDPTMPPIIITMDEFDRPKVVVNVAHRIWLSLHRKTIGGSAEALFGKINEILTEFLAEQRAYVLMEQQEMRDLQADSNVEMIGEDEHE